MSQLTSSVVDPNRLNLNTDPGFWPNIWIRIQGYAINIYIFFQLIIVAPRSVAEPVGAGTFLVGAGVKM